jgi:hypothetical protein
MGDGADRFYHLDIHGREPREMQGGTVYGFHPELVRKAKKQLREVVSLVTCERPDREFLVPILTTMLTVALNDFIRNHPGDASYGYKSPEEAKQAMQEATAKMQAWDAQVTEASTESEAKPEAV